MQVTRNFTFSAAHHLTNYRGICERLHGHTYHLSVTVEGKVHEDGLVVDFAVLKEIVERKIISKIDHTDLNIFFKNPSAEHIVEWVWKQLKNIGKDAKRSVKLIRIRLWEGDNTYVTYDGD